MLTEANGLSLFDYYLEHLADYEEDRMVINDIFQASYWSDDYIHARSGSFAPICFLDTTNNCNLVSAEHLDWPLVSYMVEF